MSDLHSAATAIMPTDMTSSATAVTTTTGAATTTTSVVVAAAATTTTTVATVHLVSGTIQTLERRCRQH